MPGQTTRGDMVFTWTEILGDRPGSQQAPFGNAPTPHDGNEPELQVRVRLEQRPEHQRRQVSPFGAPTPPLGALGNCDHGALGPTADPRTAAMSKPFEGRAELEIDRNHWKREALRYKQLLMDMLGKEVE